jgi:hypothetical protein
LERPRDYAADCRLIGRRAHEFQDAPNVSDARRLPPNELCRWAFWQNCQHRCEISKRQDFYLVHYWEYADWLRDAAKLGRCWDSMETATGNGTVVCRRRALVELRRLMGPDAYYSGQWPPYVPVGRFQSMD